MSRVEGQESRAPTRRLRRRADRATSLPSIIAPPQMPTTRTPASERGPDGVIETPASHPREVGGHVLRARKHDHSPRPSRSADRVASRRARRGRADGTRRDSTRTDSARPRPAARRLGGAARTVAPSSSGSSCASIGTTPEAAMPVRSVTIVGPGSKSDGVAAELVQHERTQAIRVASGTSDHVPKRCANAPPRSMSATSTAAASACATHAVVDEVGEVDLRRASRTLDDHELVLARATRRTSLRSRATGTSPRSRHGTAR